jgi:uncharacterized tellurite resistance protein B-like protein
MLDTIRDFFDRHFGTAATGSAGDPHAVALATAALLVEVVRLDGGLGEAEREAVLRSVNTKFGLTATEAGELVALAEAEAREATDYYRFTSLLNQHFSAAQRLRVVEHMWEVAYADNTLSSWEQHLIRKVADLLYVPQSDYVAAKLRARDAASG